MGSSSQLSTHSSQHTTFEPTKPRAINHPPKTSMKMNMATASAALLAALMSSLSTGAADRLPDQSMMRYGTGSVNNPRLVEEPHSSAPHGIIRRVYGPENSRVRLEVSKIDRKGQYAETGIRANKNHAVVYEDHPYDVMQRERRESKERRATMENGGKESPFEPIRIKFVTDSLDNVRTAANAAKIDFIKQFILPSLAEVWSNALSVVPVSGNLKIDPGELQNSTYCGDSDFSVVPDSHMLEGVENADLVVYVSAGTTESSRFCGPATLGVGVACNFDQFDRPTAGALNFCLDTIDLDETGNASPAVERDSVDMAIHEAGRILGFSSNSLRYFYDSETGMPRTARPFSESTVTCVDGVERTLFLPSETTLQFFDGENGQRHASIVTPKVRAVARNQYNCQDLEGAQLENQPTGSQSCFGDHFDERTNYPELMSGVMSPTGNALSPFTLALMDDTGWYKANFTTSTAHPWGLNAGCDFVRKPCLVTDASGEPSVSDSGRGYFCAKASDRGCSPSHKHKMACTVIDYSLFFPQILPDEQFQYFPDDPSRGGPRQADYCPVYGSTYSGLNSDQLDCRDPDNADLLNFYSEDFSPNSMCFETSSDEGRCYTSQCVHSDFVLKVNIRGEWLTCERDFQELSVKVGSSAIATTITCPRLSQACPEMFCPSLCSGRGKCNYDAMVDGVYRPRCECFDPDDTSPACSDSQINSGAYLLDTSMTPTSAPTGSNMNSTASTTNLTYVNSMNSTNTTSEGTSNTTDLAGNRNDSIIEESPYSEETSSTGIYQPSKYLKTFEVVIICGLLMVW